MQNNQTTAKKAAIYVKVEEDGQTERERLQCRCSQLENYCRSALGIQDYEVFESFEFLSKRHSPAFQEMMDRCKAGEFSHIVVSRIDQISPYLGGFLILCEQLEKYGVTLVSMEGPMEIPGAVSPAMMSALESFSEWEDNWTLGQDSLMSRERERVWIGGRVPYGYGYVRDGEGLFLLEKEAAVVRRIFIDYLVEKSVPEITARLNREGVPPRAGHRWSNPVVWSILRNAWYIGRYRYNRYDSTVRWYKAPQNDWVSCPDHHPAIVADEVFRAAQRIAESTSDGTTVSGYGGCSDDILHGIVRCGECGCHMRGLAKRVNPGEFRPVIYTCDLTRKHLCGAHSATEEAIGSCVFNFLRNLYWCREHLDEIEDPPRLGDALIRGEAFRQCSGLSIRSIVMISRTLLRFLPDPSTAAEEAPGRPDPEWAELLRQKRSMEEELDRLAVSFVFSRLPLPEEEYLERREELAEKLSVVNEKLGWGRVPLRDSSRTESVYRALAELCELPVIAEGPAVDYRRLVMEGDRAAIRKLLGRIIDSVVVRDGLVQSVILLDGTKADFGWKRTPQNV